MGNETTKQADEPEMDDSSITETTIIDYPYSVLEFVQWLRTHANKTISDYKSAKCFRTMARSALDDTRLALLIGCHVINDHSLFEAFEPRYKASTEGKYMIGFSNMPRKRSRSHVKIGVYRSDKCFTEDDIDIFRRYVRGRAEELRREDLRNKVQSGEMKLHLHQDTLAADLKEHWREALLFIDVNKWEYTALTVLENWPFEADNQEQFALYQQLAKPRWRLHQLLPNAHKHTMYREWLVNTRDKSDLYDYMKCYNLETTQTYYHVLTTRDKLSNHEFVDHVLWYANFDLTQPVEELCRMRDWLWQIGQEAGVREDELEAIDSTNLEQIKIFLSQKNPEDRTFEYGFIGNYLVEFLCACLQVPQCKEEIYNMRKLDRWLNKRKHESDE